MGGTTKGRPRKTRGLHKERCRRGLHWLIGDNIRLRLFKRKDGSIGEAHVCVACRRMSSNAWYSVTRAGRMWLEMGLFNMSDSLEIVGSNAQKMKWRRPHRHYVTYSRRQEPKYVRFEDNAGEWWDAEFREYIRREKTAARSQKAREKRKTQKDQRLSERSTPDDTD